MTEVQVDPRTGLGSDGRQYRQTESGLWRACAAPGEMFRGAAVAGVGVMLAAVAVWMIVLGLNGW